MSSKKIDVLYFYDFPSCSFTVFAISRVSTINAELAIETQYFHSSPPLHLTKMAVLECWILSDYLTYMPLNLATNKNDGRVEGGNASKNIVRAPHDDYLLPGKYRGKSKTKTFSVFLCQLLPFFLLILPRNSVSTVKFLRDKLFYCMVAGSRRIPVEPVSRGTFPFI